MTLTTEFKAEPVDEAIRRAVREAFLCSRTWRVVKSKVHDASGIP